MMKTTTVSKSILIILLLLFLTSCKTRKDVVYFQNVKNFETMVDTDTFNAKLKIGDILSIYVSTLVPSASAPYNIMRSTGNQSELINYLIDVDGNIDYPVLGKIKLIGLTVEGAKQLLRQKFENGNLLKDPVIIIRLLNYRVTVAGEVRNPGVYPVSGERVSILEALGMAGDLTIKGRRDNVLVIRNFNGTKTYTRIDLTSKEVFNSPVFYLTQNDYVYVEPNHSAVSGASGDTRINTLITITSFIVTTALIFVTRN
ncbi:polysaccharide biosynthesis/export family protein [Gaetbulibacter sp. M240]|uniref:polysaccharide biosynthesis/export family protein n=1 Tax=Gaetbulibacter sp. M240 TaxID=3126511 RepID=UPI00374F7642